MSRKFMVELKKNRKVCDGIPIWLTRNYKQYGPATISQAKNSRYQFVMVNTITEAAKILVDNNLLMFKFRLAKPPEKAIAC